MAVKYKTPVKASMALSKDSNALKSLLDAGWDIDYLTNSKGIKEFGVLHRLAPCTPSSDPSAPTCAPTLPDGETPASGAGSNLVVARAQPSSEPEPDPISEHVDGGKSDDGLTLDVASLPTLARTRQKGRQVVVAIDTEFYYIGGERSRRREILTWQLTFAEPLADDVVHSLVFFSCNGKRLGLGRALSYCIFHFDLARHLRQLDASKCPSEGFRLSKTRRWIVPLGDTKGACWDDWLGMDRCEKGIMVPWGSFTTFEEALRECRDPEFTEAYEGLRAKYSQPGRIELDRDRDRDDEGGSWKSLAGYQRDFRGYHRDKLSIPVTILCHAGKADISSFSTDGDEVDVMRQLSEVQGGLISMDPFSMDPRLPNRESHRFYPLRVTVRDTMCFAPQKHKSLDELGESVGLSKLALKQGYSKDDMAYYLAAEPVAFMEYASRDAEVTLRYAGILFGFNRSMPHTASSAAVTSVIESAKNVLSIHGKDQGDQFDLKWSGVRRANKGLEWDPRKKRYEPKYDDEPVSFDAKRIQEMAKNSYRGGANGCSAVGWIDGLTHDLDLCSAYPTAMSLVYLVDWESDSLIEKEWRDELAAKEDFKDPFAPMWAYVDWFEFPPDISYPCIAMNVNGCIVFPRTLGERDGIAVTGIEIWLALAMGATVHIKQGYRARKLVDFDGSPIRPLAVAVGEFVRDRTAVKRAMKRGQQGLVVIEQLLKNMVNSVYGKSAQAIIEKYRWNAYSQSMEELGVSRITSPTLASFTTAIVRCLLMAAMCELDRKGKRSYSFTTDGFITDASEEEVNQLELFGLAPYLRAAREQISGTPKVWEQKHYQEAFFNASTRGNISPYAEGVCAHNGFTSPYEQGSDQDRRSCLDAWLSRTGKVDCTMGMWASFRDMSDTVFREDFSVEDRKRKISMDFDMKRKPVRESLKTVFPCIEQSRYETCNVDTVPYESPEEYEAYKAKAQRCSCLRTLNDWEKFFDKIDGTRLGRVHHIADMEWSKIMTCVMGHRLHLWNIPELDRKDKSVTEKCEWIQGFNESEKAFRESDWKNARKQERQCQMLRRDFVAEKLVEMGAEGFT